MAFIKRDQVVENLEIASLYLTNVRTLTDNDLIRVEVDYILDKLKEYRSRIDLTKEPLSEQSSKYQERIKERAKPVDYSELNGGDYGGYKWGRNGSNSSHI